MKSRLHNYVLSSHINRSATLLTVMLTMSLVIWSWGQAEAQSAETITLALQAPSQVMVGEAIPLKLQHVAGGQSVAGMQSLVLFNPTAAEYAGFHAPVQAGEVGLGTLLVPELATGTGSAVGYYTCSTPECQEVRVALAEVAAAEAATEAATEGSDALMTVEVLPLVAGQLEIKLDNLQIVDAEGRPLPFTLAQQSVTVQVGEGGEPLPAPAKPWEMLAQAAATTDAAALAAAADVTGDQTVAHADIMETALSWQIAQEDGTPCSGGESGESVTGINADINNDGCVDVADVQLAAAYVGSTVPDDSDGSTDGGTDDGADPFALPYQMRLPALHSDGVSADAAGSAEAQAGDATDMTFVVNSAGDQPDNNHGDRVCRTASGACTLRAAITEANLNNGTDRINFNIPGGGVKTIQLGGRLPSLWDASGGTIIDGYSQPGAAANTHARISNARIMIEIRGNGDRFDGITMTSRNNLARGLSLHNLRRSFWLYGSGATDNVIVGNFIGTNADATFVSVASNQQAHGVHAEQGARRTRIGGTSPAERNVISGNARNAIGLWHSPTNGATVYNNIMGISPDGTRRLANRRHGVDINYGSSYNKIGGTGNGEGNVISGNFLQGAEVSHGGSTRFNEIRGNFIGTDVTGNAGAGYTANDGWGVQLKDRVKDNVVSRNIIANNDRGGVQLDNFGRCCLANNVVEGNRIGIGINGRALGNKVFGVRLLAPDARIGPDNIIAYNPTGVIVDGWPNDGNTITRNSIFGNTGLGIDIAPLDRVNGNDNGDGDGGPNQQLNFPVINRARTNQVTGSSCAGCVIEVFLADRGAGANGQGRTLVGRGTAGSNGSFSIAVSGVAVGNHVTATATDGGGNTSEFSANVRVN